MTTVSRHAPVLRRHVPERDHVLVAARCVRGDRPWQGEFVLLITTQRVVVTQETRMLHRVRPYFDLELSSLENVTWTTDPRRAWIDFAFSVAETRHRFTIHAAHEQQIWRLESIFGRLFRRPLQMAFLPAAR
ncbi:MAG: hypothetical protein ACRDT8_07425 [Micromonosporaceae bacterium]